MSKTIKGEFYLRTKYAGSAVYESFEIEVPDNYDDVEIEEEIETYYNDFVANELQGGWTTYE